MNAESSRSHLVLSLLLEVTNKTTGAVNRGKFSLIDLAGSERAAKTGATQQQLKEANSINKSLSALGDVIAALSHGSNRNMFVILLVLYLHNLYSIRVKNIWAVNSLVKSIKTEIFFDFFKMNCVNVNGALIHSEVGTVLKIRKL